MKEDSLLQEESGHTYRAKNSLKRAEQFWGEDWSIKHVGEIKSVNEFPTLQLMGEISLRSIGEARTKSIWGAGIPENVK